jgi:catalase
MYIGCEVQTMPLPMDGKLIALSEALIAEFDAIFGLHPGFRPAHAKGVLLTGIFTPAEAAAKLSNAQHFVQPSTPVTVRFSNSTGIPLIPDNDPNANPRGMAIRFHLGEHQHTDIIGHSTDGFPTRVSEGAGLDRSRRTFADADRAVPRLASGRARLCPGTQASARQLRHRSLLRRHRDALQQRSP